MIERVGDRAGMSARKMQVFGCVLEFGMAQQFLKNQQISPGFEPVCGVTMPQGVIVVLIISFPLRSAIVITRATQQRSNLFAI